MQPHRWGPVTTGAGGIEDPVTEVTVAGGDAPGSLPEENQQGDEREEDSCQPRRPLLFEDGDVVPASLFLQTAPKRC